MGVLNLLAAVVSWPKGMWEFFIKIFNDGIGNYAWTIVVLTIVLKLILLPLDFMQKRATAKNTKMQTVLAPELTKLQKQCGDNKQLYNQKQMELYKKHNYNLMGSCVVMLINMILTLVIFFTFFQSLGKISAYKAEYQYEALKNTYIEIVLEGQDLEDKTNAEIYDLLKAAKESEAEADILKIKTADEAVAKKYGEIKDSWLWIKNIWKSDTQTAVIFTFEEYATAAKIKFESDEIKDIAKQEYGQIMSPLSEANTGGNGYYIMTILVVGVSFLSQWVMKLSMRTGKNQKTQSGKSQLIMMVLLPAIMAIFTITSNAAFALYLFASSLVGLATTPLVTLVIKAIDKKQQIKKDQEIKVSYKR